MKRRRVGAVKQRLASRGLFVERLEDRTLLASVWQNPIDRLDVDASGRVAPLDALVVINRILEHGSSYRLSAENLDHGPPPYLDVNGNEHVDPLDALAVINFLNDEPMSEALFMQRFQIDVVTGEVKVSASGNASSDGSEGESRFMGSTVVYRSTPLLDQPGDVGRKVIDVSLTNRSGETLGKTPDGTVTGLRVIFGEIKNTIAPSDPALQTTVTTAAGTGVSGSSDGAAASASFAGVSGIAVDDEGNLYLADTNNQKIRKISSAGQVSTVAGSGVTGGTDGSGTAASFYTPIGIARNPVDGAFIVSDFSGNRIRRVLPTGEVTTIAGTGAAGDVNGAGNLATFRNPYGVAVDAAGDIYVAEANGHRIRKIVKTGSNASLASSYSVSVLAGSTASPPVAGFADGTGAAALFNNPRGITVSDDGVVYASELNNRRVRRISASGQVVTIAGTGAASNVDGPGTSASLLSPQGLALIPGTNTLLVSSSGGNKVRQLSLTPGASPTNASSWSVTTVAGTGVAGDTNGAGNVATLNSPLGLAVDASRTVYVADSSNHQIRRLVPNLGVFPIGSATGSTVAERVQLSNADGAIPVANPVRWTPTTPPVMTGRQDFIRYEGALQHGETTSAEPWAFLVPEGVTSFEFTVTVEANTASLVSLASVSNPAEGPFNGSARNLVRTIAGTAQGGYIDGTPMESRFQTISDMARDSAGNLYTVEFGTHSIRRVDRDGFVTTVVGGPGRGPGGENGYGNQARLSYPRSIAIAPDGQTLFVGDGNYTIRRVSLLNSYNPQSSSSWYVSTIAGLANTPGYVDNTTGNLARFGDIGGLAVSAGGVVYVSESDTHRIRRLQPMGGDSNSSLNWHVSLVAGSPAGTAGSADGLSTNARFSFPRHLELDAGGNLFVADFQNNAIRRITPEGNVTTFAGGTGGWADGQGIAAQLYNPTSLAIDSAGYLYVGDGSNRIRRISPTGVVTTVAGRLDYGDVEGTGDQAQFFYPTGLVVDPSGSLYVATGGQMQYHEGSFTTSSGLRIRLIERIFDVGR